MDVKTTASQETAFSRVILSGIDRYRKSLKSWARGTNAN